MIVLYARVSTDAQAEKFGLSSQIHELRRFAAERYPGQPFIELADEVSGATLERPKLDELRALVRGQAVSAVVAYDPDRLSRELHDLLVLVREFERKQVTLDFVRGGFEQSDTGRMLLQMRGVIAEFERAQIRSRTLRGKLEAARRGRIYGGRHPFGYDRAQGCFIVNERDAAIVQRAFALLIDGHSVREIASIFNREGILPQRGLQWRTSTLHRILRNRSYVGEAFYNRRRRNSAVKKASAGARVRQSRRPQNDDAKREELISLRPQSEWIPLSIPAIVTPSVFERAQLQLGQNARLLSGRNDGRFYMLRGLMRCSNCGRKLTGCPTHGRYFYRCGGHDRLEPNGRCRSASVPADKMESFVIAAVRDLLGGGLLRQKIAERTHLIQAVDYEAEIAKAEREIAACRTTEERAIEYLLAPEHAAHKALFEAKLKQAAERRRAIEERRSAVERVRVAEQSSAYREDALKTACKRALRALDKLKPEQWRRVLLLLLDEIVVNGRHLEFRGILPADGIVTERADVRYENQHNLIPFVFSAELPGRVA